MASVHPPTGDSVRNREGEPQASIHAERRTFEAGPDHDLKADILTFLDEELHQPLLAAEPHPLSEEHRRRLANARKAIRAEMERLRTYESAEALALSLLARIEEGSLDELDADARFLGFRSIAELGRELAEKARAAGIDCRAPAERRRAGGVQTRREHQDRLLDEGIEETFPASDPVSVPRVQGDGE